jgi:hypothetical protein
MMSEQQGDHLRLHFLECILIVKQSMTVLVVCRHIFTRTSVVLISSLVKYLPKHFASWYVDCFLIEFGISLYSLNAISFLTCMYVHA